MSRTFSGPSMYFVARRLTEWLAKSPVHVTRVEVKRSIFNVREPLLLTVWFSYEASAEGKADE